MLTKIVAVLVLIVVIFCVYVAVSPADYRVERSISIHAPAEAVFPYLNNLRKAVEWNPFSKADPNIKMVFEGVEEGVGAKSSWEGNAQVGQGSMTIVESAANQKVRLQLDFIKPFASTSFSDYTLSPEGEKTTVTWAMTGHASFLPRAIGVLISMDKMLGSQFDKGLNDLKALAESSATK
jgi:hypothetical protein